MILNIKKNKNQLEELYLSYKITQYKTNLDYVLKMVMKTYKIGLFGIFSDWTLAEHRNCLRINAPESTVCKWLDFPKNKPEKYKSVIVFIPEQE